MKPAPVLTLVPATAYRLPEDMLGRLTASLCIAFNIRSGNELILVIGDGHEADNVDAVKSWVKRKLIDLDEPSARDMLKHLVRRLGEELEDWEANRWS
jgi:hypothetical protein